jgi:hypothetical protein
VKPAGGGSKEPQPITPLPVVLTGFQVQAANLDAVLTWTTAQELSNAYFDVERSFDGLTFTAVGQRPGHGTTSERQAYDFRDKGVGTTPGTVYYRLRQVDTDGKALLSDVQTVTFSAHAAQPAAQLTLYPNPATDYATLELSALPQGAYTIEVRGTDGRLLARQVASGGTPLRLPVATYPVGTYLVRVIGTNFHQMLKLVKE